MAIFKTPQSATNIPRLYQKQYENIFVNEAPVEDESLYRSFVNVQTGITDLTVYETGVTGLGEAKYDNGENSVAESDAILPGYDQSYTQERIWMKTSFTEKFWMFGIEKRNLVKVATDIKSTVVRKRTRLFVERLANAFVSSYVLADGSNKTIVTTGGDGQPVISASHPREDGGSNWSNIITDADGTVNVPLDLAGLAALDRCAANMVDGRGNPLMANFDTIVVVRGSRNAHWIKTYNATIAKGGKLPGSDNNDIQIFGAYKVLELPGQYFGANVDYWFAFDSSKVTDAFGFQCLEAMPLKSYPMHIDEETGKLTFKAATYLAIGGRDYRYWLGSKSTSAA